jgi:hypothetical protein
MVLTLISVLKTSNQSIFVRYPFKLSEMSDAQFREFERMLMLLWLHGGCIE